MNRISRYIIAAFGAVVTLVSCTKEPVPVPEDGGLLPKGQLREIAVSFGESTKSVLGTTIDGIYHKYKPAFCVGDRIKVSNATRSEDCVVADAGGVLKIFTNLEGALKAVYPASAANVTGTSPIPETDQWFKISTTQPGKFSDANICTATIAADGTAARFENQTALLRFYVDASIGVEKITITGTGNLATTGSNLNVITVTAPAGKTLSDVTEEPDKRLCYVAILPGANTFSIESVTTTQGTVSKTMKADFSYTLNGIFNAFLPYYIKIKVKDSPEVFQKWAYCNIGAFLPEDAGKYFMWGEVEGHRWNGTSFEFSTTKPSDSRYTTNTWNASSGFSWRNCPYTNGTGGTTQASFTKYITHSTYCAPGYTQDNKTMLDLVDDAAYVNWGEGWCLPTSGTSEDFDLLKNNAYWQWDATDKGYYIYLPSVAADAGKVNGGSGSYDRSDAKLFIPAAGRGVNDALSEFGTMGRLWLNQITPAGGNGPCINGCVVSLDASGVGEVGNIRSQGSSIRPIFHDPTDLIINPYVDDDIIK